MNKRLGICCFGIVAHLFSPGCGSGDDIGESVGSRSQAVMPEPPPPPFTETDKYLLVDPPGVSLPLNAPVHVVTLSREVSGTTSGTYVEVMVPSAPISMGEMMRLPCYDDTSSTSNVTFEHDVPIDGQPGQCHTVSEQLTYHWIRRAWAIYHKYDVYTTDMTLAAWYGLVNEMGLVCSEMMADEIVSVGVESCGVLGKTADNVGRLKGVVQGDIGDIADLAGEATDVCGLTDGANDGVTMAKLGAATFGISLAMGTNLFDDLGLIPVANQTECQRKVLLGAQLDDWEREGQASYQKWYSEPYSCPTKAGTELGGISLKTGGDTDDADSPVGEPAKLVE